MKLEIKLMGITALLFLALGIFVGNNLTENPEERSEFSEQILPAVDA